MLFHNEPLFEIYFGNKDDQLYPDDYLNLEPTAPILEINPFAKLKKLMRLESLSFLHQIHSASGLFLDEQQLKHFVPFKTDGDYLVTNVRRAGVGVMTGDCLPVICYDQRSNIVGIAHAGWKGAVSDVVPNMLQAMQERFPINLENMKVFFGPSAKVCCYEVGQDFDKYLEKYPFAEKVLQIHSNSYFFDLPGFVYQQLKKIGIKKEVIHSGYNICTICDEKFFSHRRNGDAAGRQMTVVCLK